MRIRAVVSILMCLILQYPGLGAPANAEKYSDELIKDVRIVKDLWVFFMLLDKSEDIDKFSIVDVEVQRAYTQSGDAYDIAKKAYVRLEGVEAGTFVEGHLELLYSPAGQEGNLRFKLNPNAAPKYESGMFSVYTRSGGTAVVELEEWSEDGELRKYPRRTLSIPPEWVGETIDALKSKGGSLRVSSHPGDSSLARAYQAATNFRGDQLAPRDRYATAMLVLAAGKPKSDEEASRVILRLIESNRADSQQIYGIAVGLLALASQYPEYSPIFDQLLGFSTMQYRKDRELPFSSDMSILLQRIER